MKSETLNTNNPINLNNIFVKISTDVSEETLNSLLKELQETEKQIKTKLNELAKKSSKELKEINHNFDFKKTGLKLRLSHGYETETSYNNEMKKLKKEHREKMKLFKENLKIQTENDLKQLNAVLTIIQHIKNGTVQNLINAWKAENENRIEIF